MILLCPPILRINFLHYVAYAKSGSVAVRAIGRPKYIQDLINSTCEEIATNNSTSLIDIRDNNDYRVRYINGNCWMVQNLRYVGDNGSAVNSMIIKAATTNINANESIVYTDLTVTPYSDYSNAKLHNSGNTTNGVWYNFAAATAGTIIGYPNSNDATQDICPKNWRLPTYSNFNNILNHGSLFSVALGGFYSDGTLMVPEAGFWWTATVHPDYTAYGRYRASSSGGKFYLDNFNRSTGGSIRCIRSN